MTRALLFFALLMVFGCTENGTRKKLEPQPEIKVERNETTSAVSITVSYINHSNPHNSRVSYVTIDTPEKLNQYRKQAEFLLSQLDEAEKRMKIREDQP